MSYITELNEPEWAREYRKEALYNIEGSDFPPYRYGLRILINPPEFKIDPKEAKNFRIEIKNEEAEIYSGKTIPNLPHFRQLFEIEQKEDKLSYYHKAYSNHFILIRINKKIEKPIELTYEIEDETFFSNIFILAEKDSEATILLRKVSDNFLSEHVRILAEKNSIINFISIQNLGKQAVNIEKRIAVTKDNAEVNWIDGSFGSLYSKSEIINELSGRNAKGKIKVLYLTDKDQKKDIYTASVHNSEETFSDILTKGVLSGSSRALSQGLVEIKHDAAKSEGYEKQEALLLDKDAEADAIPNLKIHNHDVKCSHGSSIGQIDEEKLFYLMSRGLSKKEAVKKMVEGYFAPVLDHFSKETKIAMQDSLLEYLKEI